MEFVTLTLKIMLCTTVRSMENLTLASINVRGLGNLHKRTQVFQWLKDLKFTVYFLQETHLQDASNNKWQADWGWKMFFQWKSSKSEGVAILIQPNCNVEIIDSVQIMEGRILALNVIIMENK